MPLFRSLAHAVVAKFIWLTRLISCLIFYLNPSSPLVSQINLATTIRIGLLRQPHFTNKKGQPSIQTAALIKVTQTGFISYCPRKAAARNARHPPLG